MRPFTRRRRPARAGRARPERPEIAGLPAGPASAQSQRPSAQPKVGRKDGKAAADSRLGKRSRKIAGNRLGPSTRKSLRLELPPVSESRKNLIKIIHSIKPPEFFDLDALAKIFAGDRISHARKKPGILNRKAGVKTPH